MAIVNFDTMMTDSGGGGYADTSYYNQSYSNTNNGGNGQSSNVSQILEDNPANVTYGPSSTIQTTDGCGRR